MNNKVDMQDVLAENANSNELFQDACNIIEQAQVVAYRAINETLIKRNWLLGKRIQHEVLKDQRAEYGEQVVKNLSKDLVNKYGKGFQLANLYHFISFYNYYPDIFYAVSRKSENRMLDSGITKKQFSQNYLPNNIIFSYFCRHIKKSKQWQQQLFFTLH